MSAMFACPHGHRWRASFDDADSGETACPLCGAAALRAEGAHSEPGSSTMQASEGSAATGLPSIAGYEVIELIGRGGMGAVYRARHLRLNRMLAVKVLLERANASPQQLARFHLEAEALASLQHPNVVQIHEVGEHDLCPYLALELVEGGTLATRIKDTPQPARESAQLIQTLAEAMHAVHQRGVVHRDLKPANILLANGGREPSSQTTGGSRPPLAGVVAKITDFGLAKKLDGGSGQTHTGAVVGTPSYMAPEQARGQKDVGPLADVYALGAILYECLTGKPPFEASSGYDTILQVVQQEPTPPRRLNPRVPADLETITLKCLRKEPAKRYPTAQHLADDLGRWLNNEPITARPVGTLERLVKWARRRPGEAILTALVVVVATVGASIAVGQYLKAERAREAEAQRADRETAANALAGKALEERNKTFYESSVLLADREWHQGKITEFGEALRQCPEPLRGWEWFHLDGRNRSDLATFRDYQGSVNTLAFSPRGDTLAMALHKGVVRLVDVDSGRVLRELPGHGHPIGGIAWSPDGRRLIVGTGDQRVLIWPMDDAKGKPEALGPFGGIVYALAHHPKKPNLVAAAGDLRRPAFNEIGLWDLTTRQRLRALTGQQGGMSSIAFSPDGARIASGCAATGFATIWDTETGKSLLRLPKDVKDPPLPRLLPILGMQRGQQLVFLTGRMVYGVTFSPNGRWLATVHNDRAIRLWSIPAGQLIRTIYGHDNHVTCVAIDPEGRWLATGSYDQTVRLWAVSTGEELRRYVGHTGGISAIAVRPTTTPGEMRIVSGGDDWTVRMWDPLQSQESYLWTARDRANFGAVFGLAIAPDGRTVAVGGGKIYDMLATGPIQVFDARERRELAPFPGHKGTGISRLAYSPDGKLLASGAADGSIKLWDVATRKEVRSLRLAKSFFVVPTMVLGLAFSTDGSTLAACGRALVEDSPAGIIQLWDVKTGKEKSPLRGHSEGATCLAYSPDGKWLASGSTDRTVRIWDVASGQEVKRLPRHSWFPIALAWSHDSKRLAVGGGDPTAIVGRRMVVIGTDPTAVPDPEGEVRVWDVATEQEVWRRHEKDHLISGVTFTPDGQRVVASYRDKMVRVLEAKSGRVLLSLSVPGPYVCSLAMSGDGRYVATGGWQGTVSVWEGGRR